MLHNGNSRESVVIMWSDHAGESDISDAMLSSVSHGADLAGCRLRVRFGFNQHDISQPIETAAARLSDTQSGGHGVRNVSAPGWCPVHTG
jgi:hypothetical protein